MLTRLAAFVTRFRWWVIGGWDAVGLPMAVGALRVLMSLALVFVDARATDMSIFVLNISSFLGLGMAVDYSMLMVSRFRKAVAARRRLRMDTGLCVGPHPSRV